MNAGSASRRRTAAQASSGEAIRAAASHLVDLLGLHGPTGPTGPVQVHAAPYVTIRLAAAMTGYSAKAIERKIETAVWIEGREWRRAPDGRRLISIAGFARWVESGLIRY